MAAMHAPPLEACQSAERCEPCDQVLIIYNAFGVPPQGPCTTASCYPRAVMRSIGG